MVRIPRISALAASLLVVLALGSIAQDAEKPRVAGPTDRGFLLPNGWTLTPAGDQVLLNDLPLNILPSADSKTALVATSGFNDHKLSVIDLAKKAEVSSATVKQSWFGLASDEKAGRVWWSGGGAALTHEFRRDGDTIARVGAEEPKPDRSTKEHFRSGLTLDPEGKRLYSLDVSAGLLRREVIGSKDVPATAWVGQRPYDVKFSRDGKRLYVSDWADRSVRAFDPETLALSATIAVGEHPNQVAIHPTDGRVFVACASSNSVSAIDPKEDAVVETISTALFPRAPEGSTPDALAVSPDGKTLFVANADNNCVAVIDVEAPGRSAVKGFIPTGWYPSSVAVTPDGKTLLVGVGKGNQTKANPFNAEFAAKVEEARRTKAIPEESLMWLGKYPYIGTTLSGALSIVPIPDDKALAAFTEAVYKNCPYSDKLLEGSPTELKTAIPTKVGDPSPIEHVIYIIKENRTYDQVFGDVKRGNGDPSLCMFGEKVTPNHHKLAEEFVLLDNLYCNGHVSADGHPWSTMAYNTDYIARNWALTYSRRAGIEDDDDHDLARAPSGYLWDACKAAGLSYRSYGEYGRRVSEPDGSFRMEGAVPGLVGHFCPNWGLPKPDKTPVRDTDRVETFLEEFRKDDAAGTLPRFTVMSLGEDHTTGTTPGTFTPEACVASNDLALGRLVEAVTKSKSWPKTAIFVIEDDAQNGPDHVDAHRTIGLVISPFARRKVLDSTQYGTVSMLRTMELILGLKPLSQFDAAATPMYRCFTDRADLSGFAHEEPRIDLNAKNTVKAFGAARSAKMDFSEYDRVDDFELNEILWKAIKGEDAPMPPAVRRAIAYRTARP